MKNYEKYGRELKKYRGSMFCDDYVKPDVLKLKKDDECDHDCIRCLVLQTIWLLEEYEEPEEPEVDWSKVEVDTPILVRRTEDEKWCKRHFAKCDKYGLVYTWKSGCTSWTEEDLSVWSYAKLIEDKEDYKEPEVDWSKVKVDTPILVTNFEDGEGLKRHFAKYENGLVYAWNNGETSWTTVAMTDWNYAKLAEGEKEDKEPEVDWNEVKIDTPILVRFKKDKEWEKRHFAKYEDGKVYTWSDGHTSWTTEAMTNWNYAKLAENAE